MGSTHQLPVDRGWAWVIMAAAFVVQLIGVGIAKSFGLLFVEILERYPNSTGEASWILSLNVLVSMMLGPISSSLGLKVTHRAVIFVGGLCLCLGFATSAYAEHLSSLYLTYGVFVGIGYSCTYAPSIVTLVDYFEKRRALANGIVVAGSGLGNMLVPLLTKYLLDTWGISGTLMMIAALSLHVCVAAMLIRPISFYKCKVVVQEEPAKLLMNDEQVRELTVEKYPSQGSLDRGVGIKRNPHLSSVYYASMGNVSHTSVQSLADAVIHPANNYVSPKVEAGDHSCCHDFYAKLCLLPSPEGVKPQPIFDATLLWNAHFIVFFISAFFSCAGYINVLIIIPAHARDNNMPRWQAATILSMIGGLDLVGRILFGWLADFHLMRTRHTVLICMAASGTAILFMPTFMEFWTQCLIGALFGIFGGSYIALCPVMLAESLGPEKLPNTFGLSMVAMGISCMLSILAFGYLRDITGSWVISFYLSGASLIIGALSLLLEPLGKRHELRKHHECAIVMETEVN